LISCYFSSIANTLGRTIIDASKKLETTIKIARSDKFNILAESKVIKLPDGSNFHNRNQHGKSPVLEKY